MNKEEIFQKLTQLFASKVNYSGEFNSLFFIDTEQYKLKINFLNEQHNDFILKHLIKDIVEVVGDRVAFGHLSLKTSVITLKNDVQKEVVNVVQLAPIKKKDKVELPTVRNKTIKQIEDFMFKEYRKIMDEQRQIEQKNEDYLDNKRYYSNYGQIKFIAEIYDYMKKIKDYDDD